MVAFNGGASPGTIVVRTNERKLYLVLGEGRALRYTVGVGRAGRQWAGRALIDGKHDQAGLGAAAGHPSRQAGHAERHPRRHRRTIRWAPRR